ncbi:MAG TPA: macro domain-containing protein [Chloroflexota bacterium]|jgi:O-acetyl-ADP-ribose deacetylase (regulator of RNase III)|nr:macro domain-containing protein [Chloroflexota bacterium]
MMTETTVNGVLLRLIQGNIVQVDADAIVNAANSGLAGGGGVDGAIHRAGGPSIMEECRRIGRCPPGGAVITGGGTLAARWVIHAVAPVYNDGLDGEPETLRSAYASALVLAEQHDLRSIAFPSLGTGAYRYPVRDAARIALGTVLAHLRGQTVLRTVLFVLFTEVDLRTYAQVLEQLLTTATT